MCGLFLRKLFLTILVFTGFVQAVADIHNSCDSSINKTLEIKKFESRDDLDGFQAIDLLKFIIAGQDFTSQTNRTLVAIIPSYQFKRLFSSSYQVTNFGRAPPATA